MKLLIIAPEILKQVDILNNKYALDHKSFTVDKNNPSYKIFE